jgi:hypothetical protein
VVFLPALEWLAADKIAKRALAAIVLAVSVERHRDGLRFYMVALIFLSAFGTLAISFWPCMIPDVHHRRGGRGPSFQSGIHVLERWNLRLPADADLHGYQLSGLQGQSPRDTGALRRLPAVRIKSNLGF